MESKDKIIVVVGPTASGKSDLALRLARWLGSGRIVKQFVINGGEIISADSRQIYKGMDIGTGKITKLEQKLIKHHLLDAADPKREFNVTHFKKLAEKAMKAIELKSKVPIVVGGTGFFIDALVYDQKFPEVLPNKKLRAKLEKQSAEELFAQLQKLDLERAFTIDPHNKRRLIRALEIVAKLGKVPKFNNKSQYNVLWLGIVQPKEELEKRIKIRLDKRLRQGMVAEVKRLHRQGLSWQKLEDFGLEYRWIARYLQNKISRKDMRENLLRDIIRYSKRQMTWFKRNHNIHWIENEKEAERLISLFL